MFEWLVFLRTVCAVAEGAAELCGNPREKDQADAAACILAVLNDPRCRLAVVGGREGMPRSLGSVYSGSVTRFLGGFRGGSWRTIATPGVVSACSGVAVSRDGSMLLAPGVFFDTVHVFSVHTGARLRTIVGCGSGPFQVWVASDGFVFAADSYAHRIQIQTPQYDFHSFVGVGKLNRPVGVCANDDVIVVTEHYKHRLSVFNRNDGALVRRFGGRGRGDGQLMYPAGTCFMPKHRHVAVADLDNDRVSVWTLEGKFVRHAGVGTLNKPTSVACSDEDDLIVADRSNSRAVMLSASGEILWTSQASAAGDFTGVTLHGGTIFGQTADGKCVVFL